MVDPLKDPRFSHISWDPKFNRIPRRERKVKIDDRFKSMFTDSKFKAKYVMDKRGKSISRDSNQDLKKYYELSGSSDSDSDEKEKHQEAHLRKAKIKKDYVLLAQSPDETSSSESGHTEKDENKEVPRMTLDLARGEGNLASSSDEDENGANSSDDEWRFENDDRLPEHRWGELDADAPRTNNASRRLALCNADWDRMKAKDILVVLNSFKPSAGVIRSVKIYTSDFGKQRMTEENLRGPQELIELSAAAASTAANSDTDDDHDNVSSDDVEQDSDAEQIRREKIRQHELNRLRYFYAVVECDTSQTANAIYEACDGVEYESSATKIDLRFIPDDTKFDDDPTDEATEVGDLAAYEPVRFRNAALQQSKVQLTWDETKESRKELVKRAFDKSALDKLDLKEILASGSSDSDDDDGRADNLKHLVEDILKNDAPKIQRDTFFEEPDEEKEGIGLPGTDVDLPVDNIETEELEVSKKKKGTSYKEYRENKKLKKRQRQEEAKANKEKSKKLNAAAKKGSLFDDEELPAGVDLDDPYFKDELDRIGVAEEDTKFSDNSEIEDEAKVDAEEEQRQKDQLELLLTDANEGEATLSKNYSLKKLIKVSSKSKKKRRRDKVIEEDETKQEDSFQIDVKDSRFSNLFSSHLFNIDPTEPAFKRTKNMQILVEERLRRSTATNDLSAKAVEHTNTPDVDGDKCKKDAELNLLVKSVKSKAANFKRKPDKNKKR